MDWNRTHSPRKEIIGAVTWSCFVYLTHGSRPIILILALRLAANMLGGLLCNMTNTLSYLTLSFIAWQRDHTLRNRVIFTPHTAHCNANCKNETLQKVCWVDPQLWFTIRPRWLPFWGTAALKIMLTLNWKQLIKPGFMRRYSRTFRSAIHTLT